MTEKLIENYQDFGDALILNVEYKSNIDLSNNTFKSGISEVILIISCFNRLKENTREIIKIKFSDIEDFRFVKYDRMIMDTYIGKENEFYLIDFDPIISTDKNENWINKKNSNSELSIKFKNLHYEKIE
ncbi:hypothetical protein [Flavobacterium aquicola]|uniref:Immunity protein 50 of polymorphic toxin system n=1 Tax=Flavobacterium aquicola TaxID=1682742 RepID=A0A3E0DX39_9FLAO|nr:hypothetical protein [Flavobacterium aquicola]REG88563.1 hypothetical protein C8P67_1337 [Flavobacterium aquicola]